VGHNQHFVIRLLTFSVSELQLRGLVRSQPLKIPEIDVVISKRPFALMELKKLLSVDPWTISIATQGQPGFSTT
jgi:hypothetical protein